MAKQTKSRDLESIVAPFCIFHSHHGGYIVPATPSAPTPMFETEQEPIKFRCMGTPSGRGWEHAGTFFAISPMFRPIPAGMKIYGMKRKNAFPYEATDFQLAYDPYDIDDNTVYFTTYNQPVPNTVPLFIYRRGEKVFPTLNSAHPGNGWELNTQVFVMTAESMGTDVPHTFRFTCVNGRCLPVKPGNTGTYSNVYNYSADVNGINGHKPVSTRSLAECVIGCNVVELEGSLRLPGQLLPNVKKEAEKDMTRFQHIPGWIPPVLIFLVIGGITLTFFFALQRVRK